MPSFTPPACRKLIKHLCICPVIDEKKKANQHAEKTFCFIVKNLFAANGGLYDLEGIIEPVLLPEP